ncbi:hypothetical protein BDQ12DRAFT_713488 [Crucibulum laeve]|uniref:Uncharacterized protein n=1 Tax=Crucibulum laeve TaxID=68775 RepID=A0A5C3LX07_9AGAR|nr:hypothetical protein BDQ12DRAFT_713488 [Crucibulum laeve]
MYSAREMCNEEGGKQVGGRQGGKKDAACRGALIYRVISHTFRIHAECPANTLPSFDPSFPTNHKPRDVVSKCTSYRCLVVFDASILPQDHHLAMPTHFGDFQPLCSETPSYPWCNLFYRQLQRASNATLLPLSVPSVSAPVGINPECGILRLGHDNSIGNVANIAVCAASVLFVAFLVWRCNRRKAAVVANPNPPPPARPNRTPVPLPPPPHSPLAAPNYWLHPRTRLPPPPRPNSNPRGSVAALFWALLANALVATRSPSSRLPYSAGPPTSQWNRPWDHTNDRRPLQPTGTAREHCAVRVDQHMAGGVSSSIILALCNRNPPLTHPPPSHRTALYLLIMSYIVLKVLNETRPMWFYLLSAALFVLSQLDWFLLSKVICKGSNQKVDGSFITTLLETALVSVLYLAWKSITEAVTAIGAADEVVVVATSEAADGSHLCCARPEEGMMLDVRSRIAPAENKRNNMRGGLTSFLRTWGWSGEEIDEVLRELDEKWRDRNRRTKAEELEDY